MLEEHNESRSKHLAQMQELFRPVPTGIVGQSGKNVICSYCGGLQSGGYSLCYSCQQHVNRAAHYHDSVVADRVVLLSAAYPGLQFHSDIFNYKNEHLSASQRNQSLRRLQALTWAFTRYHVDCLITTSHLPPTAYTTVPSGTVEARRGSHPVNKVSAYLPDSLHSVGIRRTTSIGRTMDPTSLDLISRDDIAHIAQKHVIVFDDTWTSGAKAQGVAVFLRMRGASEVTIICCARYYSATWYDFAAFRRVVDLSRWSVLACPVTRGACPPGKTALV